jgi:hypothetical protein
MIGDKKTYTLSEKSFRKQAGRGMWVDSVFGDHGRTMRVTKVGQRYKDGAEWLIDVEAVEIEKNKPTEL